MNHACLVTIRLVIATQWIIRYASTKLCVGNGAQNITWLYSIRDWLKFSSVMDYSLVFFLGGGGATLTGSNSKSV
jgi:hypothetical protein